MSVAILALDQRSATFCVPKTGRPVSVVTADLLLQIIFEGYDWIHRNSQEVRHTSTIRYQRIQESNNHRNMGGFDVMCTGWWKYATAV